MWGLGGLTWGLMIRYLGVGLGLAVGCGCARRPARSSRRCSAAIRNLMAANWGQATLVGVVVALVGIVVTGAAGMSKEQELSEEQKRATVASSTLPKAFWWRSSPAS